MPEVEIDIDDLLEVNSEDERAVKLQVSASSHTGERGRLWALFIKSIRLCHSYEQIVRIH